MQKDLGRWDWNMIPMPKKTREDAALNKSYSYLEERTTYSIVSKAKYRLIKRRFHIDLWSHEKLTLRKAWFLPHC